ncbi:MAG TPA: hypothetical protein VL098_09715 [Flavipsychrobacter sp.]|uniref:hypothetical protein n=1 Tax=Agriterribacter sp. TaxID=2821509 RepID=UPI002BA226A2|nr:hypothetical protein [Agriterribacter sp.]HTN08244.1 hypothetical protein [Agriterribacter sp.]HTN46610.1 hypothetical protein [Flavipsychrobacter sp.]
MEVFVDNHLIPIRKVCAFYQKEPFPGNHNYTLRLNFENSTELEKVVTRFNLHEIDSVNWSTFFLYLTAHWPFDENATANYFINNVQEIFFSDYSIKLHGVCSDVLRK